MLRRHSTLLSILLLAAGLLGSCGDRREGRASLARLRRGIEGAPRIELFLPAASAETPTGRSSEVAARARTAARVLGERLGKQVVVLAAEEAGDGRALRIVLGRPDDPLVLRLIEKSGIPVREGRWVYRRQVLTGAREVMAICFEDPERKGLPLGLYLARDPGQLVDLIEDLTPSARPGIRFFRHGRSVVQLSTTAGERAEPWRLSGSALKRPTWTAVPVRAQPGYRLERLAGVAVERAEAYATRVEQTLAELASWAGPGGFASAELLGVETTALQREATGACGLSVSGGRRGFRVVLLAAGVPDDAGAAVARGAARSALGEPAASWMLDGAGLDAAGSWWGRDLASWGRRLARRELLPSLLETVAETSIDRFSRHQLAPARGLFFRFLREGRDPEALRALWRGDETLVIDGALEAAFRSWLLPPGEGDSRSRELESLARLERLVAKGFQRGVAFDSTARPGGGYDHGGTLDGMKWAVLSGANSASVTSFFSERLVEPSFPGGSLPEGRDSLEGDAAIAMVAAAARAASVEVLLLAPHLLLSDSAGHSAWLRRTDRDSWQEFFEAYRPMLVHYGLLAELCGFDLLCIGTGLTASGGVAALGTEVQRYYEEQWGESIETARRAFGGALTYAAGSPGEVKGFPHWEGLDYLGLSFFPPLVPADALPPGDAHLRRKYASRLGAYAALAAELDRPVLFVETGVRSTARASTETSIGPGPAEVAEQERAQTAMRLALEGHIARGFDVRGVYLWKWDADPDAGGLGDRGFTLVNKPAASQLRLFGRGD